MTREIGPSLAGTALSNKRTTVPTRDDKLQRLSHLIDVTVAIASLVSALWTPETRFRCQNDRAVMSGIL